MWPGSRYPLWTTASTPTRTRKGGPVTVTVLLFASYAERLGLSSLGLDLPEGATVRTLLDSVGNLPGASCLPPLPLVAVNRNYARVDTRLAEGDEVALIPPVAGG